MIAPGVEIVVAGLICLSPEPLERLVDAADNAARPEHCRSAVSHNSECVSQNADP